jgi:uncharacterized protein
MAEKRPNRVVGGAHDEFWSWCRSQELRMQRCDHCRHLSWPPVQTCEACNHAELTWERLSGTGRLVSWCTFERSYYAELPIPWDTIVVELDEGPFFISNPAGFGNEQAVLGTPVSLTFLDCEDDHGQFSLPVFGLVDET